MTAHAPAHPSTARRASGVKPLTAGTPPSSRGRKAHNCSPSGGTGGVSPGRAEAHAEDARSAFTRRLARSYLRPDIAPSHRACAVHSRESTSVPSRLSSAAPPLSAEPTGLNPPTPVSGEPQIPVAAQSAGPANARRPGAGSRPRRRPEAVCRTPAHGPPVTPGKDPPPPGKREPSLRDPTRQVVAPVVVVVERKRILRTRAKCAGPGSASPTDHRAVRRSLQTRGPRRTAGPGSHPGRGRVRARLGEAGAHSDGTG